MYKSRHCEPVVGRVLFGTMTWWRYLSLLLRLWKMISFGDILGLTLTTKTQLLPAVVLVFFGTFLPRPTRTKMYGHWLLLFTEI